MEAGFEGDDSEIDARPSFSPVFPTSKGIDMKQIRR